MPVVSYHRNNFRDKEFSSRLAFRWYETTGIRLRQASYRTRFQTRNIG